MATYPFIELECIRMDRKIVKLLPPEIAYRYHALPVATDGNKITVAMATPDDQAASCAVQSVINAPICLIRADLEEIDHRLDEVWPKNFEKMKFLFWPLTNESNRSYNIAKGIARSFQATLVRIEYPGKGQDSINKLLGAIKLEKPDLLVAMADNPSKLYRELASWKKRNIDATHPDLLILPSKPTLPIKNLLLVLPDSGTGCKKAGYWITRLSQSRKIDVTILPVLPPIPLCYGSFLRHNLATIMEGSDPLGNNMRVLSSQISRKNISADYKLREGDPFDQIRDEISTLDPDLIIMTSNPHQARDSWFCTDISGMLFKCIAKPILMTNQY